MPSYVFPRSILQSRAFLAECEAALGKLVESAETYRTLTRTPLPPGAPNAFVQAQAQGAAELTQVEPRIDVYKRQVYGGSTPPPSEDSGAPVTTPPVVDAGGDTG